MFHLDNLVLLQKTSNTKRGHVLVYSSDNFIIKAICPANAHDLERQMEVMAKLDALNDPAFVRTFGYVVCSDPPLGRGDLRRELGLIYEDDDTPLNYIYIFMEKLEATLFDPALTPADYEAFFFELLRGLVVARKAFRFMHGDVHTGNVMLSFSGERMRRVCFIDFDKSYADASFEDQCLLGIDEREIQVYKPYLVYSDIYRLAAAFLSLSNRLGPELDAFLTSAIHDNPYYSNNGWSYFQAIVSGRTTTLIPADDFDTPAKTDAYDDLVDIRSSYVYALEPPLKRLASCYICNAPTYMGCAQCHGNKMYCSHACQDADWFRHAKEDCLK
jgi:hypothetical protein